MSEDRKKLRELAQATPHKDWRAGSYYGKPFLADIEVLADTPDGLMVVMQGNQNFTAESVASVAFVGAASPANVLALLDDLDRLEGDLAGYKMGAKAEADAGDEARAEVRRLKAENAELRRDAERYRWVRQPVNGNKVFAMAGNGECGGNMDAAIDQAMTKEQP